MALSGLNQLHRLRTMPLFSQWRLSLRSNFASSSSQSAAAKNSTEYMRQANFAMKEYHEARELMRRGQLKPHPDNAKTLSSLSSSGNSTNTFVQSAVLVTFLLAFLASPFLGKKIATDPDFRRRFPWLDYTVEQPEHAWTRDELHLQMLAVQQHIMERAAQGEFAPEKLERLAEKMQKDEGAGEELSEVEKRQRVWDRIHPGMEPDDEDD